MRLFFARKFSRGLIFDGIICFLYRYKDQCLQEMQAGGNVKDKLLCQTERPEPRGALYEPN